jgi:hypothetical protein
LVIIIIILLIMNFVDPLFEGLPVGTPQCFWKLKDMRYTKHQYRTDGPFSVFYCTLLNQLVCTVAGFHLYRIIVKMKRGKYVQFITVPGILGDSKKCLLLLYYSSFVPSEEVLYSETHTQKSADFLSSVSIEGKQPLHKVIITHEEPWVTLEILDKQIQFLLEMRACYPVLPAYMGTPSSQTALVVRVGGKNWIRNFTPSLPCHIEAQICANDF